MIYLDLEDILTHRLDCWPLFSTRTAFALTSLTASDHCMHGQAQGSLDQRIKILVERHTGVQPRGPIVLLANLRILGVEFNPVSFYYLFDEDGRNIVNVVAEINNIPWYEQHHYVLSPVRAEGEGQKNAGRLIPFVGHAKTFHVSPFIDMEAIEYEWLFSPPSASLKVRAGLKKETQDFFMASLDMKRVPFSPWALIWLLIAYPWLTVKVICAILYEAMKLWNRGFRFYPHPKGTETVASRGIARLMSLYEWIRGLVRRQRPGEANA